MSRFNNLIRTILIYSVFCTIAAESPLVAQQKRTGLSPENQKKYDELMASARRKEILGYVLGGLAILLVVAAIPISIYMDRKKKQRKAQQARDAEME